MQFQETTSSGTVVTDAGSVACLNVFFFTNFVILLFLPNPMLYIKIGRHSKHTVYIYIPFLGFSEGFSGIRPKSQKKVQSCMNCIGFLLIDII